jgi:hypothetical protein
MRTRIVTGLSPKEKVLKVAAASEDRKLILHEQTRIEQLFRFLFGFVVFFICE